MSVPIAVSRVLAASEALALEHVQGHEHRRNSTWNVPFRDGFSSRGRHALALARLKIDAFRAGELIMYIARFSYDFLPEDREQAMDFIRRELRDAQAAGLTARMLVPFTRSQNCAALQFEIELQDLNALHDFRNREWKSDDEDKTHWMHRFSAILRAPPQVEILHRHD